MYNNRLIQTSQMQNQKVQKLHSNQGTPKYQFVDRDVKHSSLNLQAPNQFQNIPFPSNNQRDHNESQDKIIYSSPAQLKEKDYAPTKNISLQNVENDDLKSNSSHSKSKQLKSKKTSSIQVYQKIPYHPYVKEEYMKNLIKNFPGAMFTNDAFTQINNALLEMNCTPQNTLFASSVCVDEINHFDTSLNSRLKNFWGECFYMGGLGGIPFIGKVGFGAYCAHVPRGGNLFILFAPHVGITPDGTIGKYARNGQDYHDSACGAAIGALSKLKQNPPKEGDTQIDVTDADLFDIQFVYIQQALKKHYHKIMKHEDQQTGLAFAMYEIVHEFVKNIMKATPMVKLIVVGGIQINMKKPIEDMFLPISFEVFEYNKPVEDKSEIFHKNK